ncbi:LysR family transcriptional regulator [Phyllobacterium sp. 22229]|uniref:LysR family transcriptional regulator n=1 Tax=Phyllobacterium myrsinacearum TaxID=28101 RepID=A0A2S9JBU6_9HYPH|nr:LysR family transcriptional regulator [Phyllobacterium myrsinacearum]PRD50275.1 LysR family transcriptional regulator [Phyllobacterium myrsinacearum]PWV90940.1 LysR family transcriptional regulator [Phyllobacterium myrsinacearum]RZU97341.1 LysR family transcriptional regulator [Phyllobacterium myrsinacearum]
METLANLESFVRSAESGGFSAAARRLSLTPAAVSRNVAMLERNLGVRLFHRSTRNLTLTEEGERFLQAVRTNLDDLQAAIANVAAHRDEPAGVLKVSMSPTLGIGFVLPLLPAFLERFPLIRPEWHFENRQVDLIAEGFDAAIGGGFELLPGVVSRSLAPLHLIAVASAGYMRGRAFPADPAGLAAMDGIVLRQQRTGRIPVRMMRNSAGMEMPAHIRDRIVVNDPAAMRQAALLGLGVTILSAPVALPHLENGELVRLLPDWHADVGTLSIYYASRRLLPAKTRVFVDFIAEAFRQGKLTKSFAGVLG